MDNIFKQLRHDLKAPAQRSFADALFQGRPRFMPALEASEAAPVKDKPTASHEHEKTLHSLKKFTQEMTEKQGVAKLSFPGGEIVNNTNGPLQSFNLGFDAPKSWDDLDKLEFYPQGPAPTKSPDVFFLGELLVEEQTLLLDKMIAAMKLPEGSVVRYPLSRPDSFEDEPMRPFKSLAQHLYLARPRVVIPIGVMAVSLLFGKKWRLSQVRGKFYPLQLCFEDQNKLETQVAPIFHPEFLLANPTMKRTAWEDLQKIMKFLNSESE